jgi:Carboxypeptidase regulatory-like domain
LLTIRSDFKEEHTMGCKHKRLVTLLAAFVIALGGASTTSAQVFTGRIDVTVEDATGGRLPGVAVELTGPVNQTQVTDAQGQAHFLSLNVGTYTLKANLAGFSAYTNPEVIVQAGAATPVLARLGVAGTAEAVTVTAASPILDTKKTNTSTTISLDELQNIPSGRDPWVVMQTVPGIIVDRVNVGGSESGQQSGYQAKGAAGSDATWNLDGVPITDMAATGATPTYWDFDMFQEMNVTTGGSDMTSSTGGVHLNFVLKAGQNKPHGSARFYYENESMQSDNIDPALATALGSPNGKGNRTDFYKDRGFELGGPIVKDHLWAWGSLGGTEVKILTIRQTPDRTVLKNRAFKVQGQASSAIRGSFTYFKGNKEKFGRSASATRPPETTWDQGSLGPGFFKGEGNFVLRNNLFLTGRVSHYPWGFFLTPEGGLNTAMSQDDSGVWHGSYYDYRSERPMNTAAADGSYFVGKHELKFGFSWRKVEVHSATVYPGNKSISYHNGYPNMIVEVDADHVLDASAKYIDGWIGDTITLNRLTAQLGVRFDRQSDSALAMTSSAVTFGNFGQFLPKIVAPAVPDAIVWNSVSPRIGVNYSVDAQRKTQLRGSYALFASQLGNGSSGFVSVLQYRYIAFDAVDRNGNRVADANEIDYSSREYWEGFDINNPGKVSESINKIGDYSVPKTHEVIIGVDRELAPDFGVSAAFTWRKMVDFNWDPRIGLRSPSYVQVGTLSGSGLPDGSSFNVPYYRVPASALTPGAAAGGRERVTRDGYSQRFLGLEVSATKRLSNHWMGRFGFSSNKHQEFFDNRATSIQDPTPADNAPLVDGGLVVVRSTGSGKSNIYQLLPTYQFIATGLYQAPYGIDLGFNWNLRQGFGQPWFRSRVATAGDAFSATKTVLVTDVSEHRLPKAQTLDFRVGKNQKIGRTAVNFDLDIFNLLNSGTVLGRQYDLRLTGVTGFNQILEVMNPRIMRVGLRFSF